MRFIGDIHAKVAGYMGIANGSPDGESIQVGDFGHFGLGVDALNSVDNFHFENPNHRFIRGNHDNPEDCKNRSAWIPDGHTQTIEGQKTMFVGGAWSIDHAWRVLGRDYWSDEELAYAELSGVVESYIAYKPDVMVTHDCPTSIAYELFIKQKRLEQHKTRTAEALEMMFSFHKPKLWIFGHWHKNRDRNILGTRFICLEELAYVDIDMEKL